MTLFSVWSWIMGIGCHAVSAPGSRFWVKPMVLGWLPSEEIKSRRVIRGSLSVWPPPFRGPWAEYQLILFHHQGPRSPGILAKLVDDRAGQEYSSHHQPGRTGGKKKRPCTRVSKTLGFLQILHRDSSWWCMLGSGYHYPIHTRTHLPSS